MARVVPRLDIFFGAAFLALCASTLGANAQTVPAAEVYASHPGYTRVALSDDGSHAALIIPEDGGDQVLTMSFADPNDRKAYRFDDAVAFGLLWRGNAALVVQAYGRFAARPQTATRAFITYPASDNAPKLIDYQPLVGGSDDGSVSYAWSLFRIVDLEPEEENSFLMSAYVNRQPGMQRFGSSVPNIVAYDLLRAFVDTAQAREIEQGNEYTGQWITDGNGNVLARIDVLESGRQVVLVPEGDGFREVGSLDDNVDNRGDIMGLSLDGSSLAVRMRMGDRAGLYPLSLNDGSIGEPIFLDPGFDVGRVLHDERTRRVSGIVYELNMRVRYVYFDSALASVQQTLESAFMDSSVELLSRSADGSKVLFEVSSPTRPPVLGLFDTVALSAQTIVESRPDLVSAPNGAVRMVSYMSADGVALAGRLTIPQGAAEQGLPLVVLEDSPSSPVFDVLAQFLASRGYASFRPGVRDLRSIGDVSAMGELDDLVSTRHDDYMSGINQLISEGIVDPARICIFGEGEKAYTALMSTILSPDLFKCAVAVDPITDLKRLVNWARFASESSVLSYSSPLVRNYDNYAPADLERLSPITRATEFGANALIFGFESDGHGPAMEVALDRSQKPVEFVAFAGNYTDPAGARQENSVLIFEALERYLAEQLGP